MNPYFADLGKLIYGRWQEENFSLTAFPSIAAAALEEQSPSESVDLSELIREFLLSDEQPYQSASGFGQPELIVYDSPKFYGAFHVMSGSSIHSEFTFEEAESITAHFRLGTLKLLKAELLETGSTVPIVSGRTGIHSLFHLETPSLTVVVRTHSDPGTGPQFTYLPPHIAVDPVQSDTLTNRRKQLLDVLERTGDEEYAQLVAEMIGRLDFERGFFILQNCITHLRNLGVWEKIWAIFEQKHGRLAAPVVPTLEEIIRRDGIAAMRGSMEDVEQRFFLALLLNLERRSDLLEMVRRKIPGDPLDAILRWSEELIQVSESGVWILDAAFPEELELDEEAQPGIYLIALEYFIRGGKIPKELKKLSNVDLTLLRESFLRSSWRALLAE